MLTNTVKKIGKVAFYCLVLFGAVSLVLDSAKLLRGDDKKPVAQAAPEVAQVQQVTDETVCKCSAGKYCEGKRGGKYCLTDDGAKKYKQRSE